MASKRWDTRNAQARSLGYQNYYDYRIHNHGRIPPSEPAPTGEARQRLRGHRSFADAVDAVRGARAVVVSGSGRGPDGRFAQWDVMIRERDNEVRFYTLSGKAGSTANLQRLHDAIEDEGIDFEWYPPVK